MPVTITYSGATPTVDADEDTWGEELNDDALAPIKADLDALAVQGNATEEVANDALPRDGGTMTGDLALRNGAATTQYSAGFRGAPVVTIDAARTLLDSDAGKTIRLTGSTARIWTIPPNVHQTGTVIVLRSTSTGVLSIVRGVGVALKIGGSSLDGDRTIAPYGMATLLLEDTNAWVISGTGVA